MNEPQFDTLVTGVADGIAMGAIFIGTGACAKPSEIASRIGRQRSWELWVRKKMNGAPENWNQNFALIVFDAVFADCVK